MYCTLTVHCSFQSDKLLIYTYLKTTKVLNTFNQFIFVYWTVGISLKGVCHEIFYLFFPWFKPIWALINRVKVFSNYFSISPRYFITKFEKFEIWFSRFGVFNMQSPLTCLFQGFGLTEDGTKGQLLEGNVTIISNEECINKLDTALRWSFTTLTLKLS